MGGKIQAEKQTAVENLTENGIYYKKLADKYGIAGFVVLGFLIAFLLVFGIAGRREIGAGHFRYLVRHFRLSLLSEEEPYSAISYTAGSVKFAMYRDNLAVVGSGMAELYHPSGELLFRSETSGTTIASDTSGKYMAVYVPGSRSVSLYNSFDRIHTEDYEHPVSLVKVGQNGSFAVSVADGTSSAVYVYDTSFRLVDTYRSQSGLALDMALSSGGGQLAVVTLCGGSGSYYSELVLRNVKTGKTVVYEKFDSVKPIGVEFFSDGNLFAVVDGMICFYRSDGQKAGQVSVNSGVSQYLVDRNAVVAMTSPYRAVVYSSEGSVLDEISLDGKILDIDFQNDRIYFLSDGMLYIYDRTTKRVQSIQIESGALDIFALKDGNVLLCYASGPKLVKP